MLSINVFVHTLMPTERSGYCTNFAICGHCVELHVYKNPFNYLFKCGREAEAHVFFPAESSFSSANVMFSQVNSQSIYRHV